jgi:acyl-CoA reductase-like NAD-dependent aldehyde dehydrogenase
MIAFTGSTEVGQRIMRLAADDLKHIHLELGGKDSLIVCADSELEAAARAAVWGAFVNAGREETFGPVLPVEDFEVALMRSNASRYGPGATLFSSDARKVKRFMEEIEAGYVWVNDPIVDNLAGPFGGMKRSGIGRELGQEGLEEFLETKHMHWEIEGGIKSWWFPWD